MAIDPKKDPLPGPEPADRAAAKLAEVADRLNAWAAVDAAGHGNAARASGMALLEASMAIGTGQVYVIEPLPAPKLGEPPERVHTLGELAERADVPIAAVQAAAKAAKVNVYHAPGAPPGYPETWLVRHQSACRMNTREGWGLNLTAPPPPPANLNWPAWASWQGLADALNEGHPNYAPELATAVQVWLALHRDPESHVTKDKVAAAAMRLGRSKEAAKRIATVANPHKDGGAPPTLAKRKPTPSKT